MIDYLNAGFSTKVIHGGNMPDKQYGSLTMPIYQTSTFTFESCAQGERRFKGVESGCIYSRITNPTVTVAENKLALIEKAEAAIAFSSGMGAISSVFWSLCKKDVHILADVTLYGCTHTLLSKDIKRFGVEVTFADLSDLSNIENLLQENTKIVYFETPSNPTLKIIDIKALADATHKFNPDIKVVCDNTFATPYLQTPLTLGCDIVVHSATKYLNGHGDLIAGFACGKLDMMNEIREIGLKKMTGAALGPNEAFMIIRGLKTLEIRMDRHCENAQKITDYLVNHPKIEKVHYPGLKSHPNHSIAAKQMKQFGGMIAFEVKGGKAAGIKLLDNLQMCALAVSLGDVETLIEHPASMTHQIYSQKGMEKAGISQGMVRLSAGLEHHKDITNDLEQSLAKI